MSIVKQRAYSSLFSIASKIQGRHLERLAIVYVRQSTLQQVEKHSESTKLQYALVNRAQQLGWTQERILVIDEDLGRSGSSAEGRPGFQRLVAEVGLDHVGLVLGIEVSRLARSCRDWYQLLEVCALFGTLIGDTDGIYDPSIYNDRLLLGLKGTMSEAELYTIKQRMQAGRRAKASRGELLIPVPAGYIHHPSGNIQKDSDEQVQSTIKLVFDLFSRLASICAVQSYMEKHSIQMPLRYKSGPQKGDLVWRHASRFYLYYIFHNPIYAGAYAYGHKKKDPKNDRNKRFPKGKNNVAQEQWEVLLKDHLPAYITWAQYENNLKQLRSNMNHNKGVVRQGSALLSGLLVCGKCGLRMGTQYSDKGREPQYRCIGRQGDYGRNLCQTVTKSCLDTCVSNLVLEALKPAALEISLKATKELEKERSQLRSHWEQRLERLRYEVERTHRQYNAVDPENRLVARSLERQWEEALAKEKSLKDDYDRFLAEQPYLLSEEDRVSIRRLASDVPQLWEASTTNITDKKTIVRYLIEKIIVSVQGDTEKVDVRIHWAGGNYTDTVVMRPVGKAKQLSNYQALKDRILELNKEGKTPTMIAKVLSQEGWRSPRRRMDFSPGIITDLLCSLPEAQRYRASFKMDKKPHEWTTLELSKKIGMSRIVLYSWMKAGKLKAMRSVKVDSANRKIWLIYADKAEIKRLRALKNAPRALGEWSRLERIDVTT